jgi:hypothetical protein
MQMRQVSVAAAIQMRQASAQQYGFDTDVATMQTMNLLHALFAVLHATLRASLTLPLSWLSVFPVWTPLPCRSSSVSRKRANTICLCIFALL